jgi:hypothetical protein
MNALIKKSHRENELKVEYLRACHEDELFSRLFDVDNTSCRKGLRKHKIDDGKGK